jgi:hypothetical protein
MIETYEGGCHCGRVRFRVRAELSELLECNCSICTKKGILHLIVPPEQFELVSGADALSTYQFNTNTARHTFCRHCGMHPFYVPRSHPDHIDVNARCLDGVNVTTLQPKMVDGRDWEATWARGHDGRRGSALAPPVGPFTSVDFASRATHPPTSDRVG